MKYVLGKNLPRRIFRQLPCRLLGLQYGQAYQLFARQLCHIMLFGELVFGLLRQGRLPRTL